MHSKEIYLDKHPDGYCHLPKALFDFARKAKPDNRMSDASRKTVKVVAAVIFDAEGRIFATQRGYGEWKDWWEFPGGKIEPGETMQEALKREIREELDAEIEVGDLLRTIDYDYPEFHLTMHCFRCTLAGKRITLLEHEAAKWLAPGELQSVRWLPADEDLIAGLVEMTEQVHTSRITAGTPTNRAQWDDIVKNSRTGTWFQSTAAYDFFASLPDVMEAFVFGIMRQNRLKGVCVGYVTKDRRSLLQFFTRRAIIPGGPCLADDCTHEEAQALMEAVKDGLSGKGLHSPIYIETRNFNDYSPWKEAFEQAGFQYRKHLNFHIDTEAFEERLSDNRKRQIKKAENQIPAVTIQAARTESEIREWYAILSELYRTKVKTPLFPEQFFIEAFRQGIGHFLMVKHGDKIIGGSMVTRDTKCVYEWFECGLNARCKEQYPSVMATCAGIRFARTNGCERYDMMGAGEPDVPYGVRDFKAEFGGTLVEHGRFLCVCQPFLYRLGKWGVRLLKNN